jgi:hypothetical protein
MDLGIPIFLLCIANISGVLGEMFRFLYAKVLCKPCTIIKRRRALAHKAKQEESIGTEYDTTNNGGWSIDDQRRNSMRKPPVMPMNTMKANDDDQQDQNQRVAVPLTITMLIIAAYIWAGSMIFHSFEEWTMTQAGYFCFITLGTNLLVIVDV